MTVDHLLFIDGLNFYANDESKTSYLIDTRYRFCDNVRIVFVMKMCGASDLKRRNR